MIRGRGEGTLTHCPPSLPPVPLPQALKFGGRILVAHESFEPGHNGELYDTWEEIDHPDAVQTTAEVWDSVNTTRVWRGNVERSPALLGLLQVILIVSQGLFLCRITGSHPFPPPTQVYGSLAKQGFAVKYVRIPVTDGTSPAVSVVCVCVWGGCSASGWSRHPSSAAQQGVGGGAGK